MEYELVLTPAFIGHRENSRQVITMDPDKSRPSVLHSHFVGNPLRDFSAFEDAAHKAKETIVWMMNAGMSHKGGSPVGRCICGGQEVRPINAPKAGLTPQAKKLGPVIGLWE